MRSLSRDRGVNCHGQARGSTRREIPEAKTIRQDIQRLQAEVCKLQDWVKYKGLRVIVVFEGREAAGKGGTIRAITERVSPRAFRSRKDADVYPALHATFSGCQGDRHL